MSFAQILLRRFASTEKFESARAATKSWNVVCRDGHVTDLWSYGGIRWRAIGTKRIFGKCPACGRKGFMKVTRRALP